MNGRTLILSGVGIAVLCGAAMVYLNQDAAVVAAPASEAEASRVPEPIQPSSQKLSLPENATPEEREKWRILSEQLRNIKEEIALVRKDLAVVPPENTPATSSLNILRTQRDATWDTQHNLQKKTFAAFISENALDAEKADLLVRIKTDLFTDLERNAIDHARSDASQSDQFYEKAMKLAAQSNAELKQALGEETYLRLLGFARSIPQRDVLNKTVESLRALGTPLDESQIQAALAIIREEYQGKTWQPGSELKSRENVTKRVSELLRPGQQAVYGAEQQKRK